MKHCCLIVLLLLFTCKESPSVSGEAIQERSTEKVETKEFEIIIEFKTDKADEFKFMMNNIEVDEFQKKNIHVIEKTEPATNFEITKVNFGPNNISKTILINLGGRAVKNVRIKSIALKYGDNNIQITPSALTDYFSLNKYITQEGDMLVTQKIDGKYTPTLILRRKTINELTKQ